MDNAGDNLAGCYVVVSGVNIVASYGPGISDATDSPKTLRAIIQEWTRPLDNRDEADRCDYVVWLDTKVVAVMREFAVNRYEVLVFDTALMEQERPGFVFGED